MFKLQGIHGVTNNFLLIQLAFAFIVSIFILYCVTIQPFLLSPFYSLLSSHLVVQVSRCRTPGQAQTELNQKREKLNYRRALGPTKAIVLRFIFLWPLSSSFESSFSLLVPRCVCLSIHPSNRFERGSLCSSMAYIAFIGK